MVVTHYHNGETRNYISDYPSVDSCIRTCQFELDTLKNVVRQEIYKVDPDGVLTRLEDLKWGMYVV